MLMQQLLRYTFQVSLLYYAVKNLNVSKITFIFSKI